jgi:hypothetical protein
MPNGLVNIVLDPGIRELRMPITRLVGELWPGHVPVSDHTRHPTDGNLVQVTARVPGVGYPEMEDKIRFGIANEFGISLDKIEVKILPDPDGPE